jgi:hypothetical protein
VHTSFPVLWPDFKIKENEQDHNSSAAAGTSHQ